MDFLHQLGKKKCSESNSSNVMWPYSHSIRMIIKTL